jgi:hypothetical protein
MQTEHSQVIADTRAADAACACAESNEMEKGMQKEMEMERERELEVELELLLVYNADVTYLHRRVRLLRPVVWRVRRESARRAGPYNVLARGGRACEMKSEK